jgi:serine/threonine protein kinase
VAPEILLDELYNSKVDMWSLGVISFLLISGHLPFDHPYDENEIIKKIIHSAPNMKTEKWMNVSEEAKDFISNLLSKAPEKRMFIRDILLHEWIQKFSTLNLSEMRKKSKDMVIPDFKVYTSISSDDL